MSRFLFPLLAGLTLGSACFSERLPPPTFRHDCSADDDCGEGESCISGLCQVSCTNASASQDCGLGGQGGSYVGCFNGVCSSVCSLEDEVCPGAQECTTVPGLSEQLDAGLCIELCTADSCPDGEVCVEGFCAETCDPADPDACSAGLACVFGVCAPEEFAETSDTADSAETTGAPDTGDTDTDTSGGGE